MTIPPAFYAINFDPYLFPAASPGIGSKHINVQSLPFSAKGDGVTDDTAAIQAAVNVLSGTGNGFNAKSGVLYFPAGQYKITSTLNYIGFASAGLVMLGDSSSSGGTELLWYGPPGGTLFNTLGMNQAYWTNLNLNGRALAKYILRVRSNQPLGGNGASKLTFHHCQFGGWSGAGSAGVAIGAVGESFQVDTLDFYSVDFENDSSLVESGAGYLVLGNPGNQKNVNFYGGTIRGVDYGIDGFINLGGINVDGVTFLNIKKACVRMGGGYLVMKNCKAETGFNEARLLTGVGGANNNPSTVLLESNYIASSSAFTTAVAVDHFGPITLIGNDFIFAPAVPQIQTDAQSNTGEIISMGNYYRLTSGKADFRDYSGNDINLATQPIVSLGDRGGIGGAINRLSKTIGI